MTNDTFALFRVPTFEIYARDRNLSTDLCVLDFHVGHVIFRGALDFFYRLGRDPNDCSRLCENTVERRCKTVFVWTLKPALQRKYKQLNMMLITQKVINCNYRTSIFTS